MATNRASTRRSGKSSELARPRVLDVPVYSVAEAAHYLLIPQATLRSWVKGRRYPVAGGTALFEPIIQVPDGDQNRLSFTNLVEAHVLDAIVASTAFSFRKSETRFAICESD